MLLIPGSGGRAKAYARRSRSTHMSMSEFDTKMNSGEDDFHSSFDHKQALPPDFSEEDLAFAQELNTLFSPEQEDLPPYFVQTLLQAEDPRFRPVEHGFEKKT